MRTHRLFVLGLIAAGQLWARRAAAVDRIQPPEIGGGTRASLAGSLSGTAFGPGDVSRGGFSLPAPLSVPSERGAMLAPGFPSYSPDNGLSVWGMGFGTNLAITRWRVVGSLAYDFAQGDELVSPFGRLVRGSDGNWYPLGLERAIRV